MIICIYILMSFSNLCLPTHLHLSFSLSLSPLMILFLFFQAKSDTIEALEKYRGSCEPCFLFFAVRLISFCYHHHHLSPTSNFATSFLHFSLFPAALWDLANSRPVCSLMLSSHLFLCLPCLIPPFTKPCGFGQT